MNVGNRTLARRMMAILVLLASTTGCPQREPAPPVADTEEDPYRAERLEMVRQQIEARGVKDPKVLGALRSVPRHLFVAPALRGMAYRDGPLPIESDQTISQPYIVALMTDLLDLVGGERVLDVGTGSGYQAAVLAEIAAEVYSIEIIPELARTARERLAALGYDNVTVRAGDGYRGWPDKAPFDGIIVAAAPPEVPPPLIEQLAVGAKCVIPVGELFQELRVITKTEDGHEEETITDVTFVPMTGEAQEKR